MQETGTKPDLIEIFRELTEIPFRTVPSHPLRAIANLGMRALGSRACTITLIDIENRRLYQAACAGFDDGIGLRVDDKTKLLEIPDKQDLDFELFAQGKPIEKYDLRNHWRGVIGPEMASRFHVDRVLCFPMRAGGRLLGYINHLASGPNPFTSMERTLVEMFARQAVLCIERERQQSLDRTLPILNQVLHGLPPAAPGQFLQRVADGACQLLHASTCIVWEFERETGRLRVAATTKDLGMDDEYRNLTLDPNHPDIKDRMEGRYATEIYDVTAPSAKYLYKVEAAERGWGSLLTVPIYLGASLTGMIDVYTSRLLKN